MSGKTFAGEGSLLLNSSLSSLLTWAQLVESGCKPRLHRSPTKCHVPHRAARLRMLWSRITGRNTARSSLQDRVQGVGHGSWDWQGVRRETSCQHTPTQPSLKIMRCQCSWNKAGFRVSTEGTRRNKNQEAMAVKDLDNTTKRVG